MTQYIIRRLLLTIPVLFIVSSLIFLAMRVLPGDPALAALGDQATSSALETLREKWGLNKPLWNQYLDFLYKLVRGDLGRSYATNKPVNELLIASLPHTFRLTIGMIFVGILIGIPLGSFTALKRGTIWDSIGRITSLVGISAPLFYIGVLLLLLFSVHWNLFPVMGTGKPGDWWSQFSHLILPSITGGLGFGAYLTRLTRSNMLNVMNEEYIRTARAKGLKESKVIFKHGLRNVLVSITTFIGMYIIVYMGNAVLVEIVFTRPGLGRLIMGAVKQRDYMVIQSIMVLFAGLVVFMNLLVDIAYAFLDPRISHE